MAQIKNYKTEKELDKLKNIEQEYIKVCKCGHRLTIYPYEKKTSKVCNWCGNLVFVNEKEEFKYKLQKELKKNEDKN